MKIIGAAAVLLAATSVAVVAQKRHRATLPATATSTTNTTSMCGRDVWQEARDLVDGY